MVDDQSGALSQRAQGTTAQLIRQHDLQCCHPQWQGCLCSQCSSMRLSRVQGLMQGWVWRELDQYKSRVCEIGVDGHALYNLEGAFSLSLCHLPA